MSVVYPKVPHRYQIDPFYCTVDTLISHLQKAKELAKTDGCENPNTEIDDEYGNDYLYVKWNREMTEQEKAVHDRALKLREEYERKQYADLKKKFEGS